MVSNTMSFALFAATFAAAILLQGAVDGRLAGHSQLAVEYSTQRLQQERGSKRSLLQLFGEQ